MFPLLTIKAVVQGWLSFLINRWPCFLANVFVVVGCSGKISD